MARGGTQLGPVRQGPRIRSQRLDGGHLRGVDVTFAAEIAGVAGRAGGGEPGPNQLAVSFAGELRILVGG
ncbi:MAG: hypothetical protein L0214_11680, partial [candidate division NC10 bacterium]|nr:hypothetical protein [candidate division NC10 bacterium]